MALQIESNMATLFKYQKALDNANILYKQQSAPHLRLAIHSQIVALESLIKGLQNDITNN